MPFGIRREQWGEDLILASAKILAWVVRATHDKNAVGFQAWRDIASLKTQVMDEFELLQSYAARKAEDAFRSLTERYVNLVYSAAVRQMGNSDAAKDVTQAVFLTLAEKAGTLSRRTPLARWLLRTTRYAAANARRLEQRRRHYEQQAMESYVQPTNSDAVWRHIAPLLDEGLDKLPARDREAVILRFFEEMPFKRIASQLGSSEDGAQKRVSRALEKLRLFFARHGRTVSVGAMTSAFAGHCVQAAPMEVAASVGAIVAAPGVVAGSFAAAVTHATLRTITQARLRLLALQAGGVAILLGIGAMLVFRLSEPAEHKSPALAKPVVAASAPQAEVASPVVPAAIDPPHNAGELLLRVVEVQSSAPVANVRLTLVSDTELQQRTTNTFVTDANGAARVTYSTVPEKFWSHRIEIFRDGYVPKYVSWSEFQQDRIEEIPAEYTVRLQSAVTIGGVVLDEQNNPVPDARVVFSVPGPVSRSRERLTLMGDYHSEITGADGQWTCSHVPARFGMISFKLVHPLFQEKTWMTDSPDAMPFVNVDKIAEADFLAGRALMRLKPGLVIAGTVSDESGRPVADARVTQDFEFRRPLRSLLTDADGSFQFRNGRPGNLSLTVQAASLAPVVTSVVLSASVENLRIILPAGRVLRGRVLDGADNPIVGATVEAASPSRDSHVFFQWHAKTDAEGRFAWEAAPEAQQYAIHASGYESKASFSLVADGTEQTIRLRNESGPAATPIFGRVVDAETKEPPPSVRVQIWETRETPSGFSTFTTVPEDADKDGTFRRKTFPGTVSYVLEAQAVGYFPERLTNQVAGDSGMDLHIELARAPLAAGIVLTPSGEPAASATLVVCEPHESAQMNQPGKLGNGAIGSRGVSAAKDVADAQGRFRLSNRRAPEVVVVAHDQGFSELPFSQVTSNTVIRLQPWGRIEGSARAGAKPLAQETIRLSSMPWRRGRSPRVSISLDATADAEGRFVFATVPPGEWKVQRDLNKPLEGKFRVRLSASSHGMPVAVRAGETATTTLGGSGRAVIGRAVAPESIGADVWVENSIALILKIPAPDAPRAPRLEEFPSSKEFQAANESYSEASLAYWNSDAGVSRQRLQREYRAMFGPDGTFRIDDVPPGDYTIQINLFRWPKLSEGNPRNSTLFLDPVASLETDATIPPASSPSDDTLFSLGTLNLSSSPQRRPAN
jgi:RNA polymerase sigma factor (sigma-70 family)